MLQGLLGSQVVHKVETLGGTDLDEPANKESTFIRRLTINGVCNAGPGSFVNGYVN